MVDLRQALQYAAASVTRASEVAYLSTGDGRGSNVTYAFSAYVDIVKAAKELGATDKDLEGFIHSIDGLTVNPDRDFYVDDLETLSFKAMHLAYKQGKELLRDYIGRGGTLTGTDGKYLPCIKLYDWGKLLIREHQLPIVTVRQILVEILNERNLEVI